MSTASPAAFDQIALFDFTLRYQRTPCAKYHVRPLSLLQQDVLYRCDGTVTIADLADATLYTHPEIRDVLTFLSTHGLVKTLMPETWLFQPPISHSPTQPFSRQPQPQPIRRWWHVLTDKLCQFLPRRRFQQTERRRFLWHGSCRADGRFTGIQSGYADQRVRKTK